MKKGLEKFHNLVESLEMLPSIGRKSAQRMAYHMVLSDRFAAMKITHAIEEAINSIRRCERCGGLSEHELCDICSDETRNPQKLCIVESPRDILVIEENGHYDGLYFVVDSPDGLDVEQLIETVEAGVTEILFALTPGIASDSLTLYIEDKIGKPGISFYKIAQGVPTGVSLENVDGLSLAQAFEAKIRL